VHQIFHLDRSALDFYLAELATTTDAALRKERRKNFSNAKELAGNPA
jgi:hypothetical protein